MQFETYPKRRRVLETDDGEDPYSEPEVEKRKKTKRRPFLITQERAPGESPGLRPCTMMAVFDFTKSFEQTVLSAWLSKYLPSQLTSYNAVSILGNCTTTPLPGQLGFWEFVVDNSCCNVINLYWLSLVKSVYKQELKNRVRQLTLERNPYSTDKYIIQVLCQDPEEWEQIVIAEKIIRSLGIGMPLNFYKSTIYQTFVNFVSIFNATQREVIFRQKCGRVLERYSHKHSIICSQCFHSDLEMPSMQKPPDEPWRSLPIPEEPDDPLEEGYIAETEDSDEDEE